MPTEPISHYALARVGAWSASGPHNNGPVPDI
jgi:hypothetical protein